MMPKLPKKTTMKDTIKRVLGYAQKLYMNDKLTLKDFTDVDKVLSKLQKAIDK